MRRVFLLVAALFVAGVALAVPAGAHVTVTAPGATRGGSDQTITFRVPVEKDVATTGVTVALPTDTPIASVDVLPMTGWTNSEKTSKLAKPIKTDDGEITEAVTQVTWTAATGQGIKPGEFGAFTILAGQLPDAAAITFRAIQTYADGSTVRWIQTAAPGSNADVEFPAPTLTLAADKADAAASLSSTDNSGSDTGAIVLSIIALVLAAAALGLAFVSRARRSGS